MSTLSLLNTYFYGFISKTEHFFKLGFFYPVPGVNGKLEVKKICKGKEDARAVLMQLSVEVEFSLY